MSVKDITYLDVKPVEQLSDLSGAGCGLSQLGPAKMILVITAAKTDWLIKHSRHDEGSVTLQPSMIDQSRSVG